MTAASLFELGVYGAKIVQRHLAVGPGGNISVRDGDHMLISPSGFALDEVDEKDWVRVDIQTGCVVDPVGRPSSEVSMHRAIYEARPDVNAVVHAHPPVTIAVISSGYQEIPFMFPDQVAIAGRTPSLPYVIPCSEELASAVVHALGQDASVLLLQNHGLITVGATLKQAYYRTEIVEDAARVFWMAKTIGEPRALTGEEADAILGLEAERYRQTLLAQGTVT